MARATGSIKASNDEGNNSSMVENPKAYMDKQDSMLGINHRKSHESIRSKKSTISVQMEDVETGNIGKAKSLQTQQVKGMDGSGQANAFANRLADVSSG